MKKQLQSYGTRVEQYLRSVMAGQDDRLTRAMSYSLLAGGKRLRPALCLAWGTLAGEGEENILPFAAAIECIHTYSLIHDDLPAMDDDDLRRGRPSCHKQFDEATAILAGDALLTDAFTMMLGANVPPDRLVQATREIARAAGSAGMVGGQMLDMLYTGQDHVSLDELRVMHAGKTGALLTASCVSGALLGTDQACIAPAREYGRAIGLAFQIVDDILDVTGNEEDLGKPVGSDEEQGKVTYPSLVGLEESGRLAAEQVEIAQAALSGFSGPRKEFLFALADYIVQRVS